MVSFRFLLVTITSIFLSLALGITLGAAVVDRVTVEKLQSGVDTVNNRANNAENRNNELEGRLRDWDTFGSQSESALVAGRLAGQSVVVVATEGTSSDVVDRLWTTLDAAGILPAGTVWLNQGLVDQDENSRKVVVDALRASAVLNPFDSNAVPNLFANTILSTKPLETELKPFTARGLVRLQAPPKITGSQPLDAQRSRPPLVVFFSDLKSKLVNDGLPLEVVSAMTSTFSASILVVDTTPPTTIETNPAAKAAPSLVLTIRDDDRLVSLVSSVDNVEGFQGRLAMVAAFADEVTGVYGHYGSQRGATRRYPNRDA